jgi:LysM repeat protein
MYGVNEDDVYRLNPESRQLLRSGDVLRIPQKAASDAAYIYHTIAPQETLFALSQRYGITPAEIAEANPGLSVETFRAGRIIRIPSGAVNASVEEAKPVIRLVDYKVQRRETLFRISRKFNVSTEEILKSNPQLREGVKAGMVIKIPVKAEPSANALRAAETERIAAARRQADSLMTAAEPVQRADVLKVALLLPFIQNGTASTRFTEYYEGFLMAVDSLKKRGLRLELTVRNIAPGSNGIDAVLREPALKESHLIIGALDTAHVARIASFAKENHIRYVIPFTRGEQAGNNAYVFQVNTPHTYLYARAAGILADLSEGRQVIFVNAGGSDDKSGFIKAAKTELSIRGRMFRDMDFRPDSFYTDVERLLRDAPRSIVVPTSGSREALNNIRPSLRALAETLPAGSVTMFGYPEWQVYAEGCLDDLFMLDTRIYSYFFADNASFEVSRFNVNFRLWYGKMPGMTFPKYAMLGYDTGFFFLDAMARYGIAFEDRLDNAEAAFNGLQTNFRFRRESNWGGFVNTNLFLVHYNRADYRIARHTVQ